MCFILIQPLDVPKGKQNIVQGICLLAPWSLPQITKLPSVAVCTSSSFQQVPFFKGTRDLLPRHLVGGMDEARPAGEVAENVSQLGLRSRMAGKGEPQLL